MKSSTLSLLAFPLLKSTLVLGQEFVEILTIYPNDQCDRNGEFHVLESPAEMPGCTFGTFIPNSPPWEIENDNVIFYADPGSVPKDCTVALWEPNFESEVQCSIPKVTFTSERTGCVKISQNMRSFNYGYCCSDNCDQLPSLKRSVINDTSAIEDNKARDVTAVKRAAPLARVGAKNLKHDNIAKRQQEVDGCTFNPDGAIYPISVTPVQIVPVSLCTNEDGCEVTGTQSMSFSYSQTWEVGAEIGATILEVVQASVSFSYSEEYGEETSTEVSYAVNIPNGQRGYIAFTPLYECYNGAFSGNNCRAKTDSAGLCYLCIRDLLI